MKNIVCDVLVIGGGETGIRAAVEARRCGADKVILVTKGTFGETGVIFSDITFGWDMQAATGENDSSDSKEVHLEDIMNAAQGTCSKKLASVVVEEAPERVRDLEDLFGLELYKGENQRPRQVYGCFSSKNRSYQFVRPKEIQEKMKESIPRFGVTLMENMMIAELLIDGGRCFGAIGLDEEGEYVQFLSGAVILAAGGASGIYKHNFASPGMWGDGYGLALLSGCTLANMEFLQFGLGLLEPKYRALFLDRLLHLNPRIIFEERHDFSGRLEDIFEQHAKHFPFSCIDESCYLDIAIFKETLKNRKGVRVELSDIPLKKLEEIPVWKLYYGWFEEDKNPYENPLRITLFAHACNGGIVINEKAETGVLGLYAAGEAVSGPHGANRLGGNMHAACQVFGARAGANAAGFAKTEARRNVSCWQPPKEVSITDSVDYPSVKKRVGELMWEYVNVVRNEEGLQGALEELNLFWKKLKENIPNKNLLREYYETQSALLTAMAITKAALMRRESRGSHYREDYPELEPKSCVIKSRYVEGKIEAWRTDGYDDEEILGVK